MQILFIRDNLHELSKPVILGQYEKYSNMSSADNFTQTAKRYASSL